MMNKIRAQIPVKPAGSFQKTKVQVIEILSYDSQGNLLDPQPSNRFWIATTSSPPELLPPPHASIELAIQAAADLGYDI